MKEPIHLRIEVASRTFRYVYHSTETAVPVPELRGAILEFLGVVAEADERAREALAEEAPLKDDDGKEG